MLIRHILIFLFIPFIFACTKVEYLSQFRGPNRNGIYEEKGLLKAWPENGPELLWSYEGLGAGFGSVSFSKDRIFILGMPDSTGVLFALDYTGKMIWKKEYGLEFRESYGGSRPTPTVVDDLVYFESGFGIVYCYNGITGEIVWSVDLLKKFNAENITWGMTESLLIDGDRIYCTPGGKENNIAALDRFTGETIWTSPGYRQPAAYCSPVLIRHNKTSLIVTMTAESIIAVDAETGQSYWQVEQYQYNKIHANTPVYAGGRIFCSSASGNPNSGLVSLKLSDDGKSAGVEWRNTGFVNLMGGIISLDGYIYGSIYNKKKWACIDAATGKNQYTSDNFGHGVIIRADDLFYCYSEDGEMALVDADTTSFKVISKFQVPLGTDQHWSHPVIHNGRLYIRHGNALMVYDINLKQ